MIKRAPSPAPIRIVGIEQSWLSNADISKPFDADARLLQRLSAGDPLPRHLLSAMLDQYSVGRPIAGRPGRYLDTDLAS
jgi:hypothetical protein